MALPPRGSTQDLVLREVYRREIGQRITFAALISRLMQAGLHIDPKTVTNLLKLYIEELTQDVYSPSRAAASRRRRVEDRRYLEKVNKMTVKEPLVLPKKRSKRKPTK